MKKKITIQKRIWYRWTMLVLTSVLGGILMYCIGEDEYPWQMLDDPNLWINLSLAVISVAVYLLFTYASMIWVHKRLKSWTSFWNYMQRRLTAQLLYSAIPAILVAVAMAAAIAYFQFDTALWKTNYFKLDFYVVLIVTFFIQFLCYGIDIVVFVIRNLKASKGSWRPYFDSDDFENLMYLRSMKNIGKAVSLISLQGFSHLKSVLDGYGIVKDDICYIYSINKERVIRTHLGTIVAVKETIEEWGALLPPDDFMVVRRDLVVSRASVKSARPRCRKTTNIELDPPYEYDSHLSYDASKAFELWWGKGTKEKV
ncbi:LytTR family transcriptional regulator DNA-binding domain-containing protein [Sphingobacterium yanglingense]|uniref:LytTr DNA-binding domain-containing protein n=1 Tax=Sphingobacterium yanglingense TaxID=1437280 RepID=A0A4R6W9Y6_9SPHI|nr:LytTR family transcriptional regulator DNA-binding domain-containing protein [Sphingobacterium yanglingense]TDQ73665.1 LytTr DNA-binding domain-containing protein [Sphingobacterium yanglingense]